MILNVMKKTLRRQQQQEPATADEGLQAGQLSQAFIDTSTAYVEQKKPALAEYFCASGRSCSLETFDRSYLLFS